MKTAEIIKVLRDLYSMTCSSSFYDKQLLQKIENIFLSFMYIRSQIFICTIPLTANCSNSFDQVSVGT